MTSSTATTAAAMDSSPGDGQRAPAAAAGLDNGRARKKNKSRLSSGFLLNDAAMGDQGRWSRRVSRNLLQHKGKAVPKTANDALGQDPGGRRLVSSRHSKASSDVSPRATSEKSQERPSSGQASPSPPRRPTLDVDSTQIVNMALNLSESRRAAAHRPVAQPPRLAPIPDSPSGSNLKQHLQQQRRTSRNISPTPNQQPRIPSGSKPNNPLQADFDANLEGHYRYPFSASTLARAQKAKEHLELMALYRDALPHLPPLRPRQENQSDLSPPGSPNGARKAFKFNTHDHQHGPGRPYNPLQYIRNRKVRARERKVIDGERQGFGDVESVRAWVDAIAQRRNSTTSAHAGTQGFEIPTFPGAEHDVAHNSLESGAKASLRTRRPRVDWFFDPCDVVADAYWVEQGDHKMLIEDRQWRKIFPAKEGSRPTSRQIDEFAPGVEHQLTATTSITESPIDVSDSKGQLADGEAAGARERARQRLHDMKGFHHRHTGSLHGHDLLRLRRDSSSDSSDSDSEPKPEPRKKTRPRRKNTITSDTNDLLQKQMMEIVAQEARERELENLVETKAEHEEQSPLQTSPGKAVDSKNSSVTHSRKTSVVDLSEPESKPTNSTPRLGSPVRLQPGRASLEIPSRLGRSRRASEASVQSSPGLGGPKDLGLLILSNNASGQSSRAASPTRNPISRVKQKFRDRSAKDHALEPQSDNPDEERNDAGAILDARSSTDKIAPRTNDEGWKGHKSSGSIRMRSEDQYVGIRSIFKGPRLDTVIRGGLSKMSDIIWKKDPAEPSSDDSSSSDSDSDAPSAKLTKTRPALSRRESKRQEQGMGQAKHFYENLPHFQQMGEVLSKTHTGSEQRLTVSPLSRPVSRQSSRWEKLKPPKLDVSAAPGSASLAPAPAPAPVQEPDGSDAESDQQSAADADRRPGDMLDKPRSSSRHWSITDHNPAPQQTRLTKREVARMRALILSSGIKAMEIARRAHETQKPLCKESLAVVKADPRLQPGTTSWQEISRLSPDCNELQDSQVQACDMYPLASRALKMAIVSSSQRWQASADAFASRTSPSLQKQIWTVRSRLVDDLSQMTRQAADDADETSKELALDQPLRVKHVVDVIDKLLRQRRRRFRWLRRGMWLAVEWALVGFMWYVWFVVMILRVVWGTGRGVLRGVRWLLFL